MLTRCLITVVVSLSAIAGVQHYCSQASPARIVTVIPVDPDSMPAAEREHWHHLEDQGRRRVAFAQFQDELFKQLEKQELTLTEAVDRTLYYCLNHYPEHLEHVSMAEQGATLRTKIGQNVVRGFRIGQEFEPHRDFEPLIACLDSALRDLTRAENGETGGLPQ